MTNAAMDPLELAAAVRAACLRAVVEAYEAAGVQGLCAEGRWEATVGAMESLDLDRLIREIEQANAGRPASD